MDVNRNFDQRSNALRMRLVDKRLVSLIKGHRGLSITSIIMGVLGGVLTVIQAYFVSQVIAMVFLESVPIDDILSPLSIIVIVIFLRSCMVFGSELIARRISIRVKNDLRQRLWQHLMNMSPVQVFRERTGELTTAMTMGMDALDAYFAEYLPSLAMAAIIPITILLALFPLDAITGFVLLLTAPLIPVFMLLIGRMADRLTHRQYRLLGRLSAHFLDVIQGLKTLQTLGFSQDQGKVIAQRSDNYGRATLAVLRVAFLSALALEMLTTLSIAVVAVEIGLRLLYDQLGYQNALFILILAPEFYLPLRTLGSRFHAGMQGFAAAKRIFSIMDTPVRMRPPDEQRNGVPRISEAIRFTNVHCSFEAERENVLTGISFELKKGKVTALVGPSGSGKTTIAYLLLRFIDPVSGAIEIDDQPLSAIPVDLWREQIAWVPQTPYLFQDSVQNNIRIGKPDANMSAIVKAARYAHLHDFIHHLPQGYDTLIGERGVRLSAGEAQRLALARAFLRDSPILILDEPSANLDPDLEDKLVGSLQDLAADRTVLIIAHRLPTVTHADHIILLSAGGISQQGSHDELLQVDGPYRRLVKAYGGES